MSYKLSFEDRGDYLYIEVTGENSRETVLNYMQDVLTIAEKHDCFRVLINERLTGPRLEAMEVYNLASEGAMRLLGRFEAIAYVDEAMGEMGDFVESVSVNRGMPLAFFSNVEDALEWIQSRTEGPDEQYHFWDGGKTIP
jgi:hypothetical protein